MQNSKSVPKHLQLKKPKLTLNLSNALFFLELEFEKGNDMIHSNNVMWIPRGIAQKFKLWIKAM